MLMLITIEGPTGAGKTTIINNLRNSFPDIAFVDFEIIKQMSFTLQDRLLWDSTILSLGEKWRHVLAYNVGLIWLEELMKLGRPILCELCYTFSGQTQLETLSKKYRYNWDNYTLIPPLHICLERNKHRVLTGSVAFDDSKVVETHNYYNCNESFNLVNPYRSSDELGLTLFDRLSLTPWRT